MSDTPLRSLLSKLNALELSEAESRLLHTIVANGASDRAAEEEVAGFVAVPSFSLNLPKVEFNPARLRRLGNVDSCDDEPTISCVVAVMR